MQEIEGKIEERVYRLEAVLEEFIKSVGIEFNKLYNSQMRTEAELREFRKDIEKDRKRLEEEMKAFEERLEKDRKAFEEELKVWRAEMNKKWGEVTNKLGTFAEDMVAPNIKGVAKKYFGCEDFDFFAVRIKKRHSKDKTKRREFDCIAVCDEIVILNETKSNPKIEYINDFIEVLKEFYDYFPEYRDKKLIPIFASMYLSDDLVRYLTKNGIYAMAMKEDIMDLLNYEELKK
jgi:hypothetical protein